MGFVSGLIAGGSGVLLAGVFPLISWARLKRRYHKTRDKLIRLEQNHHATYKQYEQYKYQYEQLAHQVNDQKEQISQYQQSNVRYQTLIDELKAQKAELEKQNNDYKTRLNELYASYSQAENQIAELNKTIELERANADEKLDFLEQTKNTLTSQFRNIANDIFDTNSQNQQKALEQLIKPFKEQLKHFEQKIENNNRDQYERNATLQGEINKLMHFNQKMNEETRDLTNALKGGKQKQGAWGEMILETVLEQSGLQKNVHYRTQQTLRDEQKKPYRPDVIVNLPDDKCVIIDSKVSLNDYQHYVNADNEDSQAFYLKQHIQAIKKHIDDLAYKQYRALEGINQLDFVLMFMPIESAFFVAFQKDNQLFINGFDKGIVVVTPTTLMATLGIINNLWKKEYQNKNNLQIAEEANKMLDKFKSFVDNMETLGKQLSTLQGTYENSMKQLCTGKGNLIKKCEDIQKLGVKMKSNLPDSNNTETD